MTQEICVLPVKCKGCGSVFDLWYDLEAQGENLAVVLEDRELVKFLNQSFCWRCRVAVRKGLETEDDSLTEASEYEVGYE